MKTKKQTSTKGGGVMCVVRFKNERRLTNLEKKKIMSDFDFEKVLDHMTKSDWTWGAPAKVPTIEELKQVALSLLETFRIGWVRLSMGGFVVMTDITGNAVLSFCVESADKFAD